VSLIFVALLPYENILTTKFSQITVYVCSSLLTLLTHVVRARPGGLLARFSTGLSWPSNELSIEKFSNGKKLLPLEALNSTDLSH